MPKFLFATSYTAEGLKGLQKDKASGRKKAAVAAVESLGGKLDAMYFALGSDDVFVIAELPDAVAAAALGLAVSASGLIETRTTALLTVEECDRAIEKTVKFRAPGR
ncbi:MAG TPA: GYD domain-containing protein [Acetobacteraceae bacterium]|nr:GYD domain-containing protein [Acetobacteraceae bacterium]